MLVLNPDHARLLAAGGWRRSSICERLCELATVDAKEVAGSFPGMADRWLGFLLT